MKKLTLLSSLALAAAASPLPGQTILFQDDFEISEANGDPNSAVWGNVGNAGANKTIKIANENSPFGTGNYLHHRHVEGETGSLYIQASGQFSEPSTVVTVSFDFYMPSMTSWGVPNTFNDPRIRLGTDLAFSNNAHRVSHDLRFYGVNDRISSSPSDIFSKDTVHSVLLVYNHSLDEAFYYDNPSLSLGSSTYDVWLDGARVGAGLGGIVDTSSLLDVGESLTTIGFGSFAGGSELYIDNLVVYQGAIPEPSTYALGAGMLALGAAWMWRRRRAA